MNKQEIEHRIKRYELVRECAEENLNELNIQLAEAEKLEKLDKLLEKPKLGHGDYGVNKDNKNFVATKGYLPHKDIEPYYENGHSDGCDYAKSNPGDYTILGNVFDLMKDWDKPLMEFELDVHKYFIDKRTSMAHAPIHIAGNWHTLAEAEEFWHKLGRMIMTKKQSKEGD